jgi:hypothetical protein
MREVLSRCIGKEGKSTSIIGIHVAGHSKLWAAADLHCKVFRNEEKTHVAPNLKVCSILDCMASRSPRNANS